MKRWYVDVPFSATARYLVEAEFEEAALAQVRIGKATQYELIAEQVDEHARWAVAPADGQRTRE
jgi:hypothetical protein